MPTTTKTYTYNGSEIEDTSVGIRFTDGVLSPKNWEAVWTDQEKKDRGITWTTTTNWSGGSEAAEKKIALREQRNMLLQECDWTQSPDSPLSNSKKTEWATYRTNLRNLPASYDSVDDVGFAWPTKPS